MSNLNKRVSKIEAKHRPDRKIYFTIYGENGRVERGSDELIGMTEKEVAAYVGEDVELKVSYNVRDVKKEQE